MSSTNFVFSFFFTFVRITTYLSISLKILHIELNHFRNIWMCFEIKVQKCQNLQELPPWLLLKIIFLISSFKLKKKYFIAYKSVDQNLIKLRGTPVSIRGGWIFSHKKLHFIGTLLLDINLLLILIIKL